MMTYAEYERSVSTLSRQRTVDLLDSADEANDDEINRVYWVEIREIQEAYN